MTRYTVRIGRPHGPDATDYDELLALGGAADSAPDDGLVVYTARDHECAWNEMRCPCGGVGRWAEAGYVPWHRICDRCGSAWSMHVVTGHISHAPADEPSDLPPSQREQIAGLELSYEPTYQPQPEIDAERQHVLGLLRASIASRPLSDDEREHGAVYGSWAQRARFY